MLSEVSSLLSSVNRQWFLVVLVFVLITGGSAFFTAMQPSIYQARATVLMAPSDNLSTLKEVADSLRVIDSRASVATFVKIATSDVVQNMAKASIAEEGIANEPVLVRAGVIPDTSIIQVSARSENPSAAQKMAQATAEQLRSYIEASYKIVKLKIIDSAEEPETPTSPSLWRSIGSGAFLGLILGLVVAVISEGIFSLRRRTAGKLSDGG